MLTASVVGLGGAEALVRMLANGLVARGHEVVVISLDPHVDLSDQAGNGFRHLRVNNEASDMYAARENRGALYKAYGQWVCLRNPSLLKQLEKTIRGQGFQVIHTHKVRGFPRELWPRLKEYADAPLLHTCHDIELLSPLHTIAIRTSNPVKKALLYRWASLARKASTSVDTVTSPSRFMLNLHRDANLFKGARSEVIANFPDLDTSSTPELLDNVGTDEPLRISYLARLVKVKGVVALCKAVDTLVANGHKMELRIAGDGPLLSTVRDYADRCDFIHYEGIVEGGEKSRLFDWSHVVAAPASYDETFCLVAAEAITALRPVLASDRGGLPEVVTDGVTGWIYAAGETNGLVHGLQRVLDCRGQLSGFSHRCKTEADRFLPERLIGAYEDSYRELQQRRVTVAKTVEVS
jgi:glycosyltransferase involved in cell wall biosynthesis